MRIKSLFLFLSIPFLLSATCVKAQQIDTKPSPISITTTDDLHAVVGQPFTARFTASGGKSPYKFKSAKFQLPGWLKVIAIAGADVDVGGTPAAANLGQNNVQLVVKDAAKNKGAANFAIMVENPQPVSDFSVSCDPAAQQVNAGSNTSFNVTVKSINGFADPVQLLISAPSGITTQLMSNIVQPDTTTTLIVTASASANLGQYTITISGSADGKMHTTSCDVNVNAPPSKVMITNTSLSDLYQNESDQVQIVASGGSGAYSFMLDPNKTTADFLSLDAGTGILSRAPSAKDAGFFTASIIVVDKNDAKNSTQKNLGFTVHLSASNNGVAAQVDARVYKVGDSVKITWQYNGKPGAAYETLISLINTPAGASAQISPDNTVEVLRIASNVTTTSGTIETYEWTAIIPSSCFSCNQTNYQIQVLVQDSEYTKNTGHAPVGRSAQFTINAQ
jgi:hypothetical protein